MTYLRLSWGDVSRRAIRVHLGRTWVGIIQMAIKLGLQLGVPQGMETIADAARRKKVSWILMKKILRADGVQLHRPYGQAQTVATRNHCLYTDPDEVDRVYENWLAHVPITKYAIEQGMRMSTLRKIIEEANLPVPPPHASHRGRKHVPVDRRVLDPLVAAYRARKAL